MAAAAGEAESVAESVAEAVAEAVAEEVEAVAGSRRRRRFRPNLSSCDSSLPSCR